MVEPPLFSFTDNGEKMFVSDNREYLTLFEEDPENGFVIDMSSENSRVVDMLNAYLRTMGIKLDIQCDDNDKPVDIECDIPEIPKFIKKLF